MKNPDYLIIGKNVSKNARSPLLWNRVFEKLGSPHRMGSLDLELSGPEDFQRFIEVNPLLRGLAVGYPNKFHVESFLDPRNAFSQGINAVRLKDGKAEGKNFDGVGAFGSLLSHWECNENTSLTNCKFYIFGTGSTARSFQSTLIKEGVKHESVEFISSRDCAHDKIQGSYIQHQKNVKSNESIPSILVNATPLGSKSLPNLSPFSHDLLNNLGNRVRLVFDFNYGVTESGPSKFACENRIKYLDGILMNLIQAAHSFDFATFSHHGLRTTQILEIMKESN